MEIEDTRGEPSFSISPQPITCCEVGIAIKVSDGERGILLTINGENYVADHKNMAQIAIMIADVVTELAREKNKSQRS